VGFGFRSLQEAIDTTTPGGKLVFHVFAALGEFEYIELIDCCDITEFWQQQLLSIQDPIKRAVEALDPIIQPETR
jgi:hypothetical protein